MILDMEKTGFEVRDVESLREHYRKRCMPGCGTSEPVGLKQSRRLAKRELVSGFCTWPDQPTALMTEGLPSTRSSESNLPMAAAGCRQLVAHGAERAIRANTGPPMSLAMADPCRANESFRLFRLCPLSPGR